MKESPHLARLASLMGEPARAQVLTALMAGQALTATELAQQAGVSASTMSSHLSQLLQAKLIQVIAQGRHRYFSLNGDDVAQLLEMMMGVAYRTGTVRLQSSPKEPLLRKARICYDHLAGQMAVAAYEAMQKLQWIDVDGKTQ